MPALPYHAAADSRTEREADARSVTSSSSTLGGCSRSGVRSAPAAQRKRLVWRRSATNATSARRSPYSGVVRERRGRLEQERRALRAREDAEDAREIARAHGRASQQVGRERSLGDRLEREQVGDGDHAEAREVCGFTVPVQPLRLVAAVARRVRLDAEAADLVDRAIEREADSR
ncbi:hypothetical protein BE15_36770 [Sorangium cellulosum]|uniref:Uncharacterized protein n=1 Tax=Sorangium cellulosum TaxID=56 RepID=A0A150Q613_SORCE|nr:hypothetical protein BE15_36770 [Sorangium cellulosum]